MAQGVTHETLLLARHWSSPTVFVCENNGFAHSMESERLFGAPGEIARRVAAGGVRSAFADGRDVEDVNQAAELLVAYARETGSPAFIECALYRVRPHSVSDADYRYRPKEAGADWLARNDPLARTRRALDPADGRADRGRGGARGQGGVRRGRRRRADAGRQRPPQRLRERGAPGACLS